MNIQKAQLKMLTILELMKGMDESLVAAQNKLQQLRGAKTALDEAAKRVEDHLAFVDRDFHKEGKIADLPTLKLIKTYVDHCGGIVRNLASRAQVEEHQARGEILGISKSLDQLKKKHDIEHKQVKLVLAHVEQDAPTQQPGRAVGEHPGNLAADRKAQQPVKPETDQEMTCVCGRLLKSIKGLERHRQYCDEAKALNGEKNGNNTR